MSREYRASLLSFFLLDHKRKPASKSERRAAAALTGGEMSSEEEAAQDAKMVLYYPRHVSIHERRNQSGICEGIVEFLH